MAQPLSVVLAHLDQLLRPHDYDDAESNGLILEASSAVSRVGVAVNSSFHVIEEAARAGADLLFVHHAPWSSIDLRLREEKLERLRARGISLYGAHEALDRAPEVGTPSSLAKALGLAMEAFFGEGDGAVVEVAGVPFEDWCGSVSRRLGAPVSRWRHSASFRRVGMVPGGGVDTALIEEARTLGCDTYLTGEGSLFTKLFARESGLNLILAGHEATEIPAARAVGEFLERNLGLPWIGLCEPEGTEAGR